MEQENKSSIGSIIGIIIIIAVIILGGLYFWGKRVEESRNAQNMLTNSVPQTNETEQTGTINSITPGDDLDSIEKDLNNTQLDNLDAELNQ